MISIDAKGLETVATELRDFESRLTRMLGLEVHISITTIKPQVSKGASKLMEGAYIQKVKEVVCKENAITVKQLCSPARDGGKPELRFMCYGLIKDAYPKIALSRIGKAFGGRDHATVSHGLKNCAKLLNDNQEKFNQYQHLKQILNHGKQRQFRIDTLGLEG
jgi:chromosomal replication initiator protein